jgi:hypothetical protein
MSETVPVTVVETPAFLSSTRKLLDEDGRAALIDHLARNPADGDLIAETGGLPKLRWGLQGRGKRGGARVIYFYHSGNMPLFLLTAYAKNMKADLSAAEKNEYRALTKALVESYGKAKR